MNRLVLLGNGFDLAHGLPTKYEDFIFNYTKAEIDENFINQKSNSKKFFNLKLRHKKDDLQNSYLQAHTKERLVRLIGTHFIYISATSLSEKLLTGNNGNNWSDIESFFYKELIVESGVKNFKNIDVRHITDVKRLNEEFEKVKLALEYYLTEYVENKFKFKPHQKFIDILTGNKDTKSMCLLNFNYTKTAEMYLSDLNKNNPTELINIHGKLNDDRENPLIFGFGDEYDKTYKALEEFNVKSLFENIKSFGYSKSRSYNEMTNFVDGGEYEVFIIGHSCALSDRTLLKYLLENENCTSIRIFYYEGKDFYKSRNNHNYITREISRHFTNKGEMRNKMVNFLDSEPCPQVQLKEIT